VYEDRLSFPRGAVTLARARQALGDPGSEIAVLLVVVGQTGRGDQVILQCRIGRVGEQRVRDRRRRARGCEPLTHSIDDQDAGRAYRADYNRRRASV
jgi:hypothetical protein